MYSGHKFDKTQFKFARSVTAHYAKSFYLSTMLLPKKKRWATFALYGYCRHVDNLIDVPRERTHSEILQEIEFLENELRTAYRTGESLHPVIGPFIQVATEYNINMEYPLELLNGVRMDTEKTRYADFEELYLFCYRVAGVVGLMMTPVLGYEDKQAFKYAEKLGVAMQLTNILRDIKEDKEMGRIYIPLEELHAFGCNEDCINQEKMSPEFRRLMKMQIERAHDFYKESDKGIHMLDRDAQFAIFSASRIYRGILNQIEMRDYNPFKGRVFVSNSKKLRIVLGEAVRTRLPIFSS